MTRSKEQGRKGKQKKRKSYYVDCTQNSKRPRKDDFVAGLKGFLLTYNGNNAHPAITEGYRILNHFADQLYGPEPKPESEANGSTEGDSDCDDIEASIQKEVSGIKAHAQAPRRFNAVKTKAGGSVFIKTALENPILLVQKICESVESKEYTNIRLLQRLLPVSATCYASTEKIIECATALVPGYFHAEDQKPVKFCLTWKLRCNKGLSRDDVVHPICEVINATGVEHVTDYNEPEIVIAIEIIANTCAICVLHDFNRFKKYNLQSLAGFSENCHKESTGGAKLEIKTDETVTHTKTSPETTTGHTSTSDTEVTDHAPIKQEETSGFSENCHKESTGAAKLEIKTDETVTHTKTSPETTTGHTSTSETEVTDHAPIKQEETSGDEATDIAKVE